MKKEEEGKEEEEKKNELESIEATLMRHWWRFYVLNPLFVCYYVLRGNAACTLRNKLPALLTR